MNNEGVFYLMHNDDAVVTLAIDCVNGGITRIAANGNSEILPIGARRSPDELKKWWARRAVPVGQGNIQSILQEADIPTTQNLLVQNLGLSLTDHYWIKPIESELDWERVNLYENDFEEDIENVAIYNSKLDLKNNTSFYPGSSLQGDLKKKWIKDDEGNRCLVKCGSRQSANEVAATLIHKKQNKFECAEYKFYDSDEEKGCVCKSFSDINTEFIPACDVLNSAKKRKGVSDFEHFIDVCNRNGLYEDYVRAFLEYQILTDYIITNTDRNYNNFGVLRDTKTLKFVAVAPLFDCGNSLFWDEPKFSLHNDLKNIKMRGFGSTEENTLMYVEKFDLIDFDLLPTDMELKDIFNSVDMKEEDISGILYGYNKKIDMLKEFIRFKETLIN